MPAVGGNEGFGQVLEVGEEVTQFVPGDGVVLAETGLGVCKCFLDLASHLECDEIVSIPQVENLAKILKDHA